MKRISEATSEDINVPTRLTHTDQLWRFTPRGTKRVVTELIHMSESDPNRDSTEVHVRGERTHRFWHVRTRDPSRTGQERVANWRSNELPIYAVLDPGDTLELTTQPNFGDNPEQIRIHYWELEPGESPPPRQVEGLPRPSAPTTPVVQTSDLDPRHTDLVAQPPVLNDDGDLADDLTPFPPAGDQQEAGFARTRLETQLQEGIYYGRLPPSSRQVDLRLQRSLAHVVGAGDQQSHLVRATARGELATTTALRDYSVIVRDLAAVAAETIVLDPTASRLRFEAGVRTWNIQLLNEDRYNRGDDVAVAPTIELAPGEVRILDQATKALRIVPDAASATEPAHLTITAEV